MGCSSCHRFAGYGSLAGYFTLMIGIQRLPSGQSELQVVSILVSDFSSMPPECTHHDNPRNASNFLTLTIRRSHQGAVANLFDILTFPPPICTGIDEENWISFVHCFALKALFNSISLKSSSSLESECLLVAVVSKLCALCGMLIISAPSAFPIFPSLGLMLRRLTPACSSSLLNIKDLAISSSENPKLSAGLRPNSSSESGRWTRRFTLGLRRWTGGRGMLCWP